MCSPVAKMFPMEKEKALMRSLNDLEIVANMELERYRSFHAWSLSSAESKKKGKMREPFSQYLSSVTTKDRCLEVRYI